VAHKIATMCFWWNLIVICDVLFNDS